MLSKETNPKVFDRLEEKLWFCEHLNVSFKKIFFLSSSTSNLSMADQVQIEFASILSSFFAVGTWKVIYMRGRWKRLARRRRSDNELWQWVQNDNKGTICIYNRQRGATMIKIAMTLDNEDLHWGTTYDNVKKISIDCTFTIKCDLRCHWTTK